jgi:hypothetical protein
MPTELVTDFEQHITGSTARCKRIWSSLSAHVKSPTRMSPGTPPRQSIEFRTIAFFY